MQTLVQDVRYFQYADDDKLPDPNSCAVCGAHFPRGGQYYAENIGYHLWVEPDDALRLRRMKARRSLRK